MTTYDHNSPQDDLLLALIEGELDAAREAAVLATLDAPTLARVNQMRRHRALLGRVCDVAAPPQLLDRAMAVLEREAVLGPSVSDDAVRDSFQIDQYAVPAGGAWQRRLAIAAGLALFVGGIGYFGLRLAPHRPVIGPQFASAPSSSKTSGDAELHTDPQPTEQLAKSDPTTTDRVSPPSPAPLAQEPTASGDTRLAQADAIDPDIDDSLPFSIASAVSFDDADPIELALDEPRTDLTPARTWAAYEDLTPATLSVFNEMPASLDLEHAARLAADGRLVIRVRADRPAIAAARLIGQADSRANKGRIFRLMPCPPPDFEEAAANALPPARTMDDPSGLTVPYRTPMRPVVETVLSVELDPSASTIAMVQAELEVLSEGAVVFDMLEMPVTMAPPCGEDGGLRGWNAAAPTSVVHSVVVPLIVESNE